MVLSPSSSLSVIARFLPSASKMPAPILVLSPQLPSSPPNLVASTSTLLRTVTIEDNTNPPSQWVALFRKAKDFSSSTALSRFKPKFFDGVAISPSDVVAEGISRWKKFLVGYFLGRKPPLFLVQKEFEKILKRKEFFELSNDKDFIFINCINHEHRQLLLDGGPLFVAGRYMVIKEWSIEVEAQKDHLSSLPLWINLELPTELWTHPGISFGASLFCEPLSMDDHTAKMLKVKFAQVCIGIDASFKFPSSIPVRVGDRLDVVKATYKWKPQSCNKCMLFGHIDKNCCSVCAINPAAGPVMSQSVQGGMPRTCATEGEREEPPVAFPSPKEGCATGREREDPPAATPSLKEGNVVAVMGTRPDAINIVYLHGPLASNNFGILANLLEDGSSLEDEMTGGRQSTLLENQSSNCEETSLADGGGGDGT